MSSTASNYDMSKLITGQILATLSLVLSLATAGSIIISSSRTVAPLVLIALAYGIMMFASSYVEEEQHFWYWATTAWFMLLWIKK
jgi:ethanolaminephosphotransferase